jgi:hypothetical protein
MLSPIEFPLSLRPVVRSRAPGDAVSGPMPYHAAIWIVDCNGSRILDVAPDIDDVRAGRLRDAPLELVSRASRIVEWLQALHVRLESWIDPSAGPRGLVLRPIMTAVKQGRMVEAGIQFCSAPEEEFDRATREVRVLASDDELEAVLEPLRVQVVRRFEDASAVLGKLQEAVESWRSTEELTAGPDPLVIGDGALEGLSSRGDPSESALKPLQER